MEIEKQKKINKETVEYIADLSRLQLRQEEIEVFEEQLSQVLDYVAQLDEVDTSDIEPTSHVVRSMKNVFREDKLGSSLTAEEAMKASPDKKDTFFKVPKIIKET